jgi:hypothetical protein
MAARVLWFGCHRSLSKAASCLLQINFSLSFLLRERRFFWGGNVPRWKFTFPSLCCGRSGYVVRLVPMQIENALSNRDDSSEACSLVPLLSSPCPEHRCHDWRPCGHLAVMRPPWEWKSRVQMAEERAGTSLTNWWPWSLVLDFLPLNCKNFQFGNIHVPNLFSYCLSPTHFQRVTTSINFSLVQ